ncbi:MAG: hypothetical protein ACI9KN_000504 [Gammaproteobacteria bacterium]|jgi:hypothetical protein
MVIPSTPSPLRQLAKSYASNIITRDEYVKIRSQLLKKLQSTGKIEDSDMKNFILISQGTYSPRVERSYSTSDWLIIVLGLSASAVLGWVLYG